MADIKIGDTFKDHKRKYLIEEKFKQFGLTIYQCKHLSTGKRIDYTESALLAVINKH